MPGIFIGNAVGSSKQSWSPYNTYMTPLPLFAYATGETTMTLSVTDVFSGKVKLAWYRSTDGSNYSKIATTSKGVTTYSDTGLTAGTLYYYKCRAELGSKASYYSNVASTPTWVTQYTTLYNAVSGTKPSAQVADGQNYFIWYQKGNNSDSRDTWAKYTMIAPYIGGMPAAADALLWWNNPARTGALAGTHNPTYTVNQGFTGPGDGYINTSYNPSTDGGALFTQNDHSFGYHFYNHRITNQDSYHGFYVTNGGCHLATLSSGSVYGSSLSSYKTIGTGYGSNFFYIITRVGSTQFKTYRNRDDLGFTAATSGAIPNLVSYTLARNNNGSVDGYSTDTVSLQFYASSFDATDVKVLSDAYDEMMFRIGSTTPALDYSADGTTIDAAKWTVTNPNATVATFLQYDALIMRSLNGSNANTFANNVKSVSSIAYGTFIASICDVEPPAGSSSVRLWGLYQTDTRRIEFYRNPTGNIYFRTFNGASVYSVDTGEKDLGIFKIVYTITRKVQLWKWSNDAWTQVGIDNTNAGMYGPATIFMGTRGTDMVETSMRDIVFGNKNPNYLPFTRVASSVIVDVRSLGLVPDGSTVVGSAFNSGIQTGKTYIFENGSFVFDTAGLLPSNITIYAKNAKIRMSNGSYNNFFKNSDFVGGNTNIKIIGLGNFALDGNAANNNDSYVTYGLSGVNSHRYCGMFFSGVNGFQISGVKIVDRPHYGMLFHKCYGSIGTPAVIKDIYLNYYSTIINQDGIDYAHGCHDIKVDDCRGYSGDDWRLADSGAYCAFVPQDLANYNVGDIYNIDINGDVIFNAYNGALLPIICSGGNKVHDISVNNAHIYSGGSLIFSQYGAPYEGTPAPTKDEIYSITMDQVVFDYKGTSPTNYVCAIGESCKDVTITNFTNNTGKALYVESGGLDVENFTINGSDQSP